MTARSEEIEFPEHAGWFSGSQYLEGVRDSVPIAAGYFVVSFTLGIAMRNAGLTPLEGLFCSLLNNASAGEYAGITLMASGASLFETALMTLITNARYLLMSCSLSQKLSPHTPMIHRFAIGFDVTDELFGISIARRGWLDPSYFYGAVTLALPAWASGTVPGVMAGSLLPSSLISAFSAALYGMFLAIIIPEGRKNRVVLGLILLSFAASFLCSILPFASSLSEGARTIVLTVILSAGAALLIPYREEH